MFIYVFRVVFYTKKQKRLLYLQQSRSVTKQGVRVINV